MPKQKTHKGTKKRFRLSAEGKVKHRQAGTSHLATHKNKRDTPASWYRNARAGHGKAINRPSPETATK